MNALTARDPNNSKLAIRETAHTWQDVIELISQDRSEEFGRYADDYAVYWSFVLDTRSRYRSMDDYMLHTLFGKSVEKGSDGRLQVAELDDASLKPFDDDFHEDNEEMNSSSANSSSNKGGSSKQQQQIVFKKNDFPYALAPAILHYIVWSLLPMTRAQIEQLAREQLPRGYDFVLFINPAAVRSIKSVYHVHIFAHPNEAQMQLPPEQRSVAAISHEFLEAMRGR